MTVQLTRLANGMRVVSDHMPHLGTVALGVWVASGARHERQHEHGISHLLEHMAFKGTARRTAQDIAEDIEQVGGELNAATSLDATAYYARVLTDDIATALDILSDILQHPLYSEEELERERDVILQEIAATRDSPDDTVYDLALDAAFPDQPLGRPILGTPESVVSVTSADLRNFLASRYRADRMVLSAAGNVEHEALVRHAEALFGGLHSGEASDPAPACYVGGTRLSAKPFEQAHVIMAFEGPSWHRPEFYAAQVFSGLFGGGMSSRLFQEARERRALCYSIYSSTWGLADTGLFSVHAATGSARMGKLVEVVKTEFERAANDRPSQREVDRARSQLKAGLLMSLESSVSRAEQMARQLLAFGRLIPAEELIARVEAVTPESVRDIAGQLVSGSTISLALVGAGDKGRTYASLAERMTKV
jgi:predicted Zn-dependent peptidase